MSAERHNDLPAEAIGPSTPRYRPPRPAALPDDQDAPAAHEPHVVGDTSPPSETNQLAEPKCAASRLADALLLIYADALDDFERVRIATENRARALRQVKGLEASPEEARLLAVVEGIRSLEHGAELELKRALRKHPLGQWVKATVGIGEKQGGRLLATIGNPHLLPDGTPRTVSQLWAYCGYHVLHPGHLVDAAQTTSAGVDPSGSDQRTGDAHRGIVGADPCHPGHSGTVAQLDDAGVDPSGSHHGSNDHQCITVGADHPADPMMLGDQTWTVGGVAPRRQRGQKAGWNSTAKMRAFLCAEACIKQRHSPHRAIYDTGRAKYADAVHQHPCPRCGPAGKPAAVGSPLSDGHKHARALRLVAKAILRDLWREARRLDPPNYDAPTSKESNGPAGPTPEQQSAPAGTGALRDSAAL